MFSQNFEDAGRFTKTNAIQQAEQGVGPPCITRADEIAATATGGALRLNRTLKAFCRSRLAGSLRQKGAGIEHMPRQASHVVGRVGPHDSFARIQTAGGGDGDLSVAIATASRRLGLAAEQVRGLGVEPADAAVGQSVAPHVGRPAHR